MINLGYVCFHLRDRPYPPNVWIKVPGGWLTLWWEKPWGVWL